MRKKKPFHDPAPDIHDFPGVPESTFDLVNQYGTYNIQPTSHTENLFPLIGPELPERWRTMRLCEYAVTTYIDTAFPQHQLPEADRRAVIRFIKCQLFGMCIDWISGGMQDEALEELRRISRLCHGLPELIIERSREDH